MLPGVRSRFVFQNGRDLRTFTHQGVESVEREKLALLEREKMHVGGRTGRKLEGMRSNVQVEKLG